MAHDIKNDEGTLVATQGDLAVAQRADDGQTRSSRRGKATRFLMRISGAVAVVASVALGGCVAHEGDEALLEDALSEEEDVAEAEEALIGYALVQCNSGWPGTRGCSKTITSPTNIIPGSIEVYIDGHNGAISYAAVQTANKTIKLTASIHEGDAFNPGKNNTKFVVLWQRQ